MPWPARWRSTKSGAGRRLRFRRKMSIRRLNNSPPGQAEYSLIDVPTVMGNGIAAQTLAWSDFVLGIDQPGKFHTRWTD